jgi:hypothetical protein
MAAVTASSMERTAGFTRSGPLANDDQALVRVTEGTAHPIAINSSRQRGASNAICAAATTGALAPMRRMLSLGRSRTT